MYETFNGFDDRLIVSIKQLVDQKYTPLSAAVTAWEWVWIFMLFYTQRHIFI